jgi:hypothetical protein
MLAFYATSVNAIHSPYTFQEFAEGERLDEIYDNMSLDEKLGVVDEFVALLVRIESIKFSEAGRITRPDRSNDVHSTFRVKLGFGDQTTLGALAIKVDVTGFGVDGCKLATSPKTVGSILEIFKEQLDSWIVYEMSTPHRDFAAEKYKGLKKVVQQMETLGVFEAQPAPNEDENANYNILFHCDFEQKNILVLPSSGNVQTEGDRRWKISAVIDWDDTLSLPPILTRKPPIWFWDSPEIYPESNASIPVDFDGDVDLLPAH